MNTNENAKRHICTVATDILKKKEFTQKRKKYENCYIKLDSILVLNLIQLNIFLC